ATAGFTWSATANTAMVTITDSNPLSDKVLRFSLKEVSIQEGDDLFVYVRLPEGIITTKDITFNYTVTGTATPNWGWRDYVELTGTGTILAGQKEGWININTFKDTVIEDDETIILTGSVITAGPLTGFTWDDAANTATVTITDVTDEANKVLHFSPITAAVAEGSGTGIQVSLPEGVALGYPQIVNYTISGTAINGTDYKELTGSVTIYTHTYSAYIWIAAENDNLIEPDETVVITGGT
ncbi:hypothetical protein IUY40_19175, partial [Flavobacterium sp. ALJ2]|uniref:Calx-beta domain-containing protein n=1 Tax=Flavobacterium sp. ALJ2 TaxID=2786960 RepID=UPI001E592F01